MQGSTFPKNKNQGKKEVSPGPSDYDTNKNNWNNRGISIKRRYKSKNNFNTPGPQDYSVSMNNLKNSPGFM